MGCTPEIKILEIQVGGVGNHHCPALDLPPVRHRGQQLAARAPHVIELDITKILIAELDTVAMGIRIQHLNVVIKQMHTVDILTGIRQREAIACIGMEILGDAQALSCADIHNTVFFIQPFHIRNRIYRAQGLEVEALYRHIGSFVDVQIAAQALFHVHNNGRVVPFEGEIPLKLEIKNSPCARTVRHQVAAVFFKLHDRRRPGSNRRVQCPMHRRKIIGHTVGSRTVIFHLKHRTVPKQGQIHFPHASFRLPVCGKTCCTAGKNRPGKSGLTAHVSLSGGAPFLSV